MKMKSETIRCSDGVRLGASFFEPNETPKGTILICPALGVPRGFYQPFATFLSENGLAAVTFDYRGTGESVSGVPQGKDVRFTDWGTLDIDAALYHSIDMKNGPVIVIGHSAGGQLFGLSPRSQQIQGAVFTPACSANWRLYPAPFRYALFMIWHLLIPVVSVGRNTFPARMLGLSSMDVPRGVMQDWARYARLPDYFFSGNSGVDTRRYTELEIPILAYAFDDDAYASEKAIDHLLARFPRADIEKRFLSAKDLGKGRIGHFGFFKEKMAETLWSQTRDWLLARL